MWATRSLQIFANPCISACQLCPQRFTQISFNFFGKMSYLQTVYFSISHFWYKLTQPIVYVRHTFFLILYFLIPLSGKQCIWTLLKNKMLRKNKLIYSSVHYCIYNLAKRFTKKTVWKTEETRSQPAKMSIVYTKLFERIILLTSLKKGRPSLTFRLCNKYKAV